MREFLRAFNSGVFEKDLSGEQKELVRNLLNIGAISAHKGKLYLNDGICRTIRFASAEARH